MWGQLLAYMPQVGKAFRDKRPIVVTLPNPRLQSGQHIEKPSDLARRLKRRDQDSFPERRARSVDLMRRELAERGRMDLAKHLLPKKDKKTPAYDEG